ncbi:hypothetical protein KGY79_04340, partial [Candidatus Bipolaricaulota bacterium]|nr:hypothetical protein [Candidatus Bipolaricaulota bacterium]
AAPTLVGEINLANKLTFQEGEEDQLKLGPSYNYLIDESVNRFRQGRCNYLLYPQPGTQYNQSR